MQDPRKSWANPNLTSLCPFANLIKPNVPTNRGVKINDETFPKVDSRLLNEANKYNFETHPHRETENETNLENWSPVHAVYFEEFGKIPAPSIYSLGSGASPHTPFLIS